jgi:hypothetical protein
MPFEDVVCTFLSALPRSLEQKARHDVLDASHSGGDIDEAIPDPIPNSEVKLVGADGTARVILWESRTLPGLSCWTRNPPRFRASEGFLLLSAVAVAERGREEGPARRRLSTKPGRRQGAGLPACPWGARGTDSGETGPSQSGQARQRRWLLGQVSAAPARPIQRGGTAPTSACHAVEEAPGCLLTC